MASISRRWFIGGAVSFGAFGGSRFLVGNCHAAGRPNLRFGVVSDIHIVFRANPGESETARNNELTFVRTLEWFRDQGVDGVIVAGDMADNGIVDQLHIVAEAWNRVFPGDRAPDGRRVERLFVYGNHDLGGIPYARAHFKGKSDEEINANIIYPDPKGAWERTFHEQFEPIWAKDVKGYRFVGAHWWSSQGCRGRDEKFNDGIVDWYATHGKEFDPSLPFFHIQHPHPMNTCYGPWAWGRDIGLSTKALSAFPNAIAFSGHSHYPLTDERSVWQGAFTSVGTSSLRYMAAAYEEFKEGFANSRTGGKNARAIDAAKLQSRIPNPYDCREGMLWSVFDDRIVVERREFMSGLDVGEDWVLPLPAAESRPFAFAERAKKIGAPSFPAGASLRIDRRKAKTRGAKAKGKDPEVPSVEKDCLAVAIPAAVAKDGARAYYFEVRAVPQGGGAPVLRRILAEGFNHACGHARAKAETVCLFAVDELPKGAVVFSARPVNCFGRAGAAISSAAITVSAS